MDIKPEELTDYVVYQIGALQAFLEAEGAGELQHILIHGIAAAMSWYEEKYAQS